METYIGCCSYLSSPSYLFSRYRSHRSLVDIVSLFWDQPLMHFRLLLVASGPFCSAHRDKHRSGRARALVTQALASGDHPAQHLGWLWTEKRAPSKTDSSRGLTNPACAGRWRRHDVRRIDRRTTPALLHGEMRIVAHVALRRRRQWALAVAKRSSYRAASAGLDMRIMVHLHSSGARAVANLARTIANLAQSCCWCPIPSACGAFLLGFVRRCVYKRVKGQPQPSGKLPVLSAGRWRLAWGCSVSQF